MFYDLSIFADIYWILLVFSDVYTISLPADAQMLQRSSVSGAPPVAQRNQPSRGVHIAGGVGDASQRGLPQTGGAFR